MQNNDRTGLLGSPENAGLENGGPTKSVIFQSCIFSAPAYYWSVSIHAANAVEQVITNEETWQLKSRNIFNSCSKFKVSFSKFEPECIGGTHQTTCGAGLPESLQAKFASLPSRVSALLSSVLNVGLSTSSDDTNNIAKRAVRRSIMLADFVCR